MFKLKNLTLPDLVTGGKEPIMAQEFTAESELAADTKEIAKQFSTEGSRGTTFDETAESELAAGTKEIAKQFSTEGSQGVAFDETAEPDLAAGTIADASDKDFGEYIKGIKDGSFENTDEKSAEEFDTADDGDEESPEQRSRGDATRKAAFATGESAKAENKAKFTQEDVDRIVRGRLAQRSREDIARFETLNALGAEAARFYGGTPEEAIQMMIADIRGQNAQSLGVSEDDYAKQREAFDKARRYDEEQHRQAAEQDAIISRWREQSEDIKTIVPDFHFGVAMENEIFRNAIMQGKSVQTAYMLANRQLPIKQQRMNIKQNAASKKAMHGKAEFDPETASKKDFGDYIKRIKERIE